MDYEEYNIDFLQLKYTYFAASLSVVCYKVGTHRKFGGNFRHFLIIQTCKHCTHDAAWRQGFDILESRFYLFNI